MPMKEEIESAAITGAEFEGDFIDGDWPGQTIKNIWIGRAVIMLTIAEQVRYRNKSHDSVSTTDNCHDWTHSLIREDRPE